jgi:hypothetical protein
MRAAYLMLSLACVVATGAACSPKRTATAETGTSTATVSTQAPPSQVPADQLQTQAQLAATATATPVDGSGPIKNVTPKPAAPQQPGAPPPTD